MKIRLLGIYLCLLAVAQFALYAFEAVTDPDKYLYLFYYNPRFGLAFLEEFIRPGGVHNILSWISAVALFSAGIAMFYWRALNLFIIFECIMSAPSILTFLLVFVVNMNATDGFSRGELPIPIIVFLVFSGPPFLLTLLLRRKERTEIDG